MNPPPPPLAVLTPPPPPNPPPIYQPNDPVTNICQAADRQLFTLVEWAKRIPRFSGLPLDDQVILLRAGELGGCPIGLCGGMGGPMGSVGSYGVCGVLWGLWGRMGSYGVHGSPWTTRSSCSGPVSWGAAP